MVKTVSQVDRSVGAQSVMSKDKLTSSKRDTKGSTVARTDRGTGSAHKNYTSELLQTAHQEALELFTENYKEIQACDHNVFQ